MRLALLALLFTGCAQHDPMIMKKNIDTVTITWIDRECGYSAGCALPMNDKCLIALRKDSPDWLVAHEVKHCFGFEHTR